MADVAALAGVSGQTVSRVANNSPRVDPETRLRVEQAMAELGYRPHQAARALRTGRTHTIGLVLSTLATVGNSRMLQATVEAAEARGFAVVVVTAEGAEGVAHAFERLRERDVDAAIVVNEASEFALASHTPAGLPIVLIDAAAARQQLAAVSSDHAGGARAAVQHLLQQGHTRIAHLAGPEGSFAALERERGWREALLAAGVEPAAVARGDWTAESGFALAGAFAEASAIFCANDQMALGAIRALSDAGRRVPEDVSVVGFDDVPEAANYRPPLTTVRQDFAGLAEQALTVLQQLVSGQTISPVVPVPTPLVVRDSVRPPIR